MTPEDLKIFGDPEGPDPQLKYTVLGVGPCSTEGLCGRCGSRTALRQKQDRSDSFLSVSACIICGEAAGWRTYLKDGKMTEAQVKMCFVVSEKTRTEA
jgi:hypothetical protein